MYWPEGQRWVRLRLCTRAIKTIEKKGLAAMAAEAGLDLSTLPYTLVPRYVLGGPRVVLTRDPAMVASAEVRGPKAQP